jgi:hypothetical protein
MIYQLTYNTTISTLDILQEYNEKSTITNRGGVGIFTVIMNLKEREEGERKKSEKRKGKSLRMMGGICRCVFLAVCLNMCLYLLWSEVKVTRNRSGEEGGERRERERPREREKNLKEGQERYLNLLCVKGVLVRDGFGGVREFL